MIHRIGADDGIEAAWLERKFAHVGSRDTSALVHAGGLEVGEQALLRRVAGSYPGSPFRSGGLEVDLTRRLVKVRGRVVRLTPTEYDLLKALIQAAGKVLTHQQLLRQVWGPAYTTASHLLRVNVATLREKLGQGPVHSTYIITEPRIGYRLRTDDYVSYS